MDIYSMKDSVYIAEKEKEVTKAWFRKPAALILTISIILILLLNLINTFVFS